ncbi:MAG: hypothetical protein VW397_09305, partial [Candidatus Margulisiibacteriota bacterium]
MKIKNYLPLIGLLLLISFNVLGETTVPLKLNVSAVLRYSDGTEINTVTSENVKIGLYSTSTDYVWRKTFSLMITNGLIEATLNGEGTNSAGNSLQLTETLFETEGLKVGFTIVEDGQEKLALVELTSQPYSIKSAIADYANTAGDTTKIQGKAVSSTAPTANQILAYVNDQWVPSNLNNNMINIDNYAFPVNDETEVSGTISNVKVEKLLGKKLTSSVINGQDIPTGAVLMFSPDVDAPNGAFHPSSGDPIDGEVLTWDSVTNVWMPSTNSLVKLDDVVPPTNLTPVKNIMVYDTTLQKYKVTDLAISYFTDIDTDGANDSDILKYNATSGNWEDGTILTSDLSEGVVGSYAILDGTIKEIDLSTEYLDSEQAKETAIRADFATADAALQADIDLNESDSDAADAALQADIDLNESDSDTADAALQADIDLNESDSDTADAALQADIDQNEIDSDTADAALQADIDLNESDSDTA